MAKDDKRPRISDVSNPFDQGEIVYAPEHLEGKELVLVDWFIAEGSFGQYLEATFQSIDGQHDYKVTSGAKSIVRQFENLTPEESHGLICRFRKVGKTWILV